MKLWADYPICPKFWDRRAWANNADQDQMQEWHLISRSTLFATYPAIVEHITFKCSRRILSIFMAETRAQLFKASLA